MSILNPRENFLKNPVAVKRYREFVDDPIVQSSVQAVLIEFAKTNPSSEAMKGANYVLERLVQFSETPAPIKTWPNHGSLTHPSDVPAKPREISKK
jgi:hypothetical protein